MLILRFVVVLATLLLVISGGMYLITRDPRYIEFARQTLRYTVLMLLVFALLYILERYVLVGWKVLL